MYQSLVDSLKIARVAQAVGMRGEIYTVSLTDHLWVAYELIYDRHFDAYKSLSRLYRDVCEYAGFMPTFHAVESTRKA